MIEHFSDINELTDKLTEDFLDDIAGVVYLRCQEKLKEVANTFYTKGYDSGFEDGMKINQNTPLHDLRHVGFNVHDCANDYKCPVCGELYDDWDFTNGRMKIVKLQNDINVFVCKCGSRCKVPD